MEIIISNVIYSISRWPESSSEFGQFSKKKWSAYFVIIVYYCIYLYYFVLFIVYFVLLRIL